MSVTILNAYFGGNMKQIIRFGGLALLAAGLIVLIACGGGGGGGITPPSGGTAETRINGDTFGNEYYQKAAFNSSGDGIAVWDTYLGGWPLKKIGPAYSYYSASTGQWSIPAPLATEGESVGIASNGTGFVATYERSDNIYARQFDGSAWGSETRLDAASSNVTNARIASNGTGYMAIWAEYTGVMYRIFANIHNGVDWEDPATLLPVDSGAGSGLGASSIASDGTNYALGWAAYNSVTSEYDVYAMVYNGSGWDPEVVIDNSLYTANSGYPVLASNGTGYAAAWVDDPTGAASRNLYVSMYNGTGWDDPGTLVSVASSSANASGPTIASDGTGYAVAWGESDGNAYSIIHDGSSWQAVDTFTGGYQASIASNGAGYAVAFSSSGGIKANIYNGAGWDALDATIQSTPGSSYSPVIASGGAGYHALWYQDNGSSNSTYANHYDGASWEASVDISEAPLFRTLSVTPAMATNSGGVTMAVWSQYESNWKVFCSLHNGIGWEAPAVVSVGSADAIDPSVASDGTGFMVAYAGYSVNARLFNGTAWESAVRLDSVTGSGRGAQVISNGTSYAVSWRKVDAGQYSVFARIYNGAGWDAETLLEQNPDGMYNDPVIATNGTGYAVAWAQYDGSTYSTYANLSNGTGWQPLPTLIENGTGYVYDKPAIASDGAGYAVVWKQQDTGAYYVFSNIHNGSAWEGAAKVESSTWDSRNPSVASDGSSYMVAWLEDRFTIYSVHASLYNGTGWDPEVPIESGSGNAYSPMIASDGTGYRAVWLQDDGSYASVYSSSYSAGVWGAEEVLESISSDSSEPFICHSGTGYSAVWSQQDPAFTLFTDIWANTGL